MTVLQKYDPGIVAKTFVRIEQFTGLEQVNWSQARSVKYSVRGIRTAREVRNKIVRNIRKLEAFGLEYKLTGVTEYCAASMLRQHDLEFYNLTVAIDTAEMVVNSQKLTYEAVTGSGGGITNV